MAWEDLGKFFVYVLHANDYIMDVFPINIKIQKKNISFTFLSIWMHDVLIDLTLLRWIFLWMIDCTEKQLDTNLMDIRGTG